LLPSGAKNTPLSPPRYRVPSRGSITSFHAAIPVGRASAPLPINGTQVWPALVVLKTTGRPSVLLRMTYIVSRLRGSMTTSAMLLVLLGTRYAPVGVVVTLVIAAVMPGRLLRLIHVVPRFLVTQMFTPSV
jgi:hypothetical protein